MTSSTTNTKITVQATINASVQKVWDHWTSPSHIVNWNFATPEWHAPKAENDLRVGGKFLTRMEAKDGSFGFDFGGIYTEVKTNEFIAYNLGDDRKVTIQFSGNDNTTTVVETFDAEHVNPVEMQRAGWQSILDNFKRYTEGNN